MAEIKRSALMPYPADFMYQVVNNVDEYPEFLPWCGGVKIHRVDDRSMEASILMKGVGMNHWLKTRNLMVPGRSIEMELLEGPFRQLHGFWNFTPIDTDGCKIELALRFEMKHGLASALIGPAFSRIANTMVESFCDRARAQYER